MKKKFLDDMGMPGRGSKKPGLAVAIKLGGKKRPEEDDDEEDESRDEDESDMEGLDRHPDEESDADGEEGDDGDSDDSDSDSDSDDSDEDDEVLEEMDDDKLQAELEKRGFRVTRGKKSKPPMGGMNDHLGLSDDE